MIKKEARRIVGGLSNPSKMPCPSYGLPASKCKTGSILAKREHTVCNGCYAMKGQYVFPNVQSAQARRLAAISHTKWTEAMVSLIEGMPYFRWHDSGDIQDQQHWEKIQNVALLTPGTLHWLPTKEKRYVYTSTPSNLRVRYSLTMIDQKRSPLTPETLLTSAVVTEDWSCPASSTGGLNCDDFGCRKCWDDTVKHITYRKH